MLIVAAVAAALLMPPVSSRSCAAPRLAFDDSIVLGVSFTIHSAALGQDRRIRVHLPSGYATGSSHYPVLFVLDGEQLFVQLAGVSEALPWAFRAPPLIVVAIDNVQRTKDMATAWTSAAPKGMYESSAPRAGGADAFLAFIQRELIPEVDRRYRTTNFRILFGHSLAGLFALHAFVHAPGLFTATIASSPTAFWNGDEVIDRMAALLGSAIPPHGYLSVTAASKEFDDTPRAVAKIGELLRLRAPQSLHWTVHTIPDADHGTALLAAAQRGLEFTFSGWRLPSYVFDQGLDAVEAYYADRSAEYGMPVPVPEGELSALVGRASDVRAAVRVARRYAALYPSSVNAAVALAEALDHTGDRAARDAYAKAIGLADSANDPRAPALRQRFDALAKTP
jgi:hypothetical protein